MPSQLLPATRGYFGIGLTRPKTEQNVGGVMRAAWCFGAAFVVVQGHRYRRQSTDTPNAAAHLPLFLTDDLFDNAPYDCEPIAVEVLDSATPLDGFQHPARAFYIFGPEDGSIAKPVLARCSRSIVIPTRGCLNLAMAVNVVLYDRIAKARRSTRKLMEAA